MELTEPPPNPLSFAAGLDGEPAPHRRVRLMVRILKLKFLIGFSFILFWGILNTIVIKFPVTLDFLDTDTYRFIFFASLIALISCFLIIPYRHGNYKWVGKIGFTVIATAITLITNLYCMVGINLMLTGSIK